jgi:KaiC/GvpD/RAD55 family RecA-like ATPase
LRLKTGIKGPDELVGGGNESSSRNILYRDAGTGKTIFAMQFLRQGLREGCAHPLKCIPPQRITHKSI